MSDEPTEVIRQVYERWNSDPKRMAEAVAAEDTTYRGTAVDLFDPEIELQQAALIFDSAGTFQGHDGVLRSAKELFAAFGSIRWEPETWRDEDEWLVVTVRMLATGELSGIETDTEVIHAWRVRNGLVTHLHVFESEEKALDSIRSGE